MNVPLIDYAPREEAIKFRRRKMVRRLLLIILILALLFVVILWASKQRLVFISTNVPVRVTVLSSPYEVASSKVVFLPWGFDVDSVILAEVSVDFSGYRPNLRTLTGEFVTVEVPNGEASTFCTKFSTSREWWGIDMYLEWDNE